MRKWTLARGGRHQDFGDDLKHHGVLSAASASEYTRDAAGRLRRVLRQAACLGNLAAGRARYIGSVMFSGGRDHTAAPGAPEVLIPLADNPRVKSLLEKARYALDANG